MSLELAEGSTVLEVTKELEKVKAQLEELLKPAAKRGNGCKGRKENNPYLKQTKELKSPQSY